MNVLDALESKFLDKKKSSTHFAIGDTVDVHVRIKEGDKERVQLFTGVVISKSKAGMRETFVVRRLVAGEGVERSFLVQSPSIIKVEVKRRGKIRRAKLYYLRDRIGKRTRVKELIKGGAPKESHEEAETSE